MSAYDTTIQGLRAWSGDASGAGWRQAVFPISQPGQTTLKIVVFVATDSTDDGLGLYLDDLVVAHRPSP